jgi:hypothetical protein
MRWKGHVESMGDEKKYKILVGKPEGKKLLGILRRTRENNIKMDNSHLILKTLKIRIYETVILPVVLYGCGTWYLTLGEEHRLRVFENSVEEDIWA